MDTKTIQPYIDKKLVKENTHPLYEWLRIYNYTNKCQIDGEWDDVTKQCRGLIVDIRDNSVVARPFPKFFNLEEHHSEIPDELPYVYDKLDGSLGILYWVNGMPFISTRGSFSSDQAMWATRYFSDFADFSEYDRSKTYLFEIIYKENRIVVQYEWEGLVLIAVRDTKTGKDDDITKHKELLNIRRAERFEYTDIQKLKELEKNNAEGFVVLYPSSGLRIKLKFEEYKRLHRIVTNVTPRSIWDALRNDSDLSEILDRVPDEFYNWVKEWKSKLISSYDAIEDSAKGCYKELGVYSSRREEAEHIMKWCKQHASVVFAMLDGKDYKHLIWKHLKPSADDAFKKEI